MHDNLSKNKTSDNIPHTISDTFYIAKYSKVSQSITGREYRNSGDWSIYLYENFVRKVSISYKHTMYDSRRSSGFKK